MARIRSIKPEFFQHESLYDAERSGGLPLRLAFAGLWTQADRDGRFEWRPRQLKLNILPYDEVDFAEVLDALQKTGFVVRYVVDGKEFGCIPSWLKHQHPNVKEPTSTIPAPSEDSASTIPAQCQSVGKGREGKGREREDASETRLARAPDGLTADRRSACRTLAPAADPDREWSAFTDWLAANDKHPADLDGAWRGWLRKCSSFGVTGSTRVNGVDQPPKRAEPPTDAEIAASRAIDVQRNREQLEKVLPHMRAAK